MMRTAHPACKIKVQILCGDEIAMGPGKADLLEAIAREGSISAAGRALGMSYRRTWLLVDTMNRCWHLPLVETAQGGRKGGGARLTDLGTAILVQFRQLQADLDQSSDGEVLGTLTSSLRERPIPLQSPRSAPQH
jgi:molybdate transport system regulatory protein